MRRWAAQLCRRLQKLVGREGVRATWWRLDDLGEPGVLAGAVSMAIRGDVIIVALHSDEPMSLPFYVWVEAWLPHRRPQTGSLLALIDLPVAPSARADEAREYLRAVARQGRLDFLVEERKLAADAPSPRSPSSTVTRQNTFTCSSTLTL